MARGSRGGGGRGVWNIFYLGRAMTFLGKGFVWGETERLAPKHPPEKYLLKITSAKKLFFAIK